MKNAVTINAVSSGSPSFGPCWHVQEEGRPGRTLYYGYDLDRAIKVYEKRSGKEISADRRAELAHEAHEISRWSR